MAIALRTDYDAARLRAKARESKDAWQTRRLLALLLTDAHRTALARAVEDGPIPAIHGVVRRRVIDLVQWLLDEFDVSVSKQTLGRDLRQMGEAAQGSDCVAGGIAA